MNTLVVARFLEDVAWTSRVPKGWAVRVYDKGNRGLPNGMGREAHTYLFHILTQYEHLDGDTAFVQGKPFDHCPKILDKLDDPGCKVYGWCEDCDPNGLPRIGGLDLPGYCRSVGITPPPFWKFIAGAQFRVSAEQILAHPIQRYRDMFQTCRTRPNSPWLFERLWPTIFNIQL